jgi:hypothetical protein
MDLFVLFVPPIRPLVLYRLYSLGMVLDICIPLSQK